MIGDQRIDINLNGFLDILQSFITSLSLRDAAGETGTFGNPVAVFTGMDDHLSHEVLRFLFLEAVCLCLEDGSISISSGGTKTTLPSRHVAIGMPSFLCRMRALRIAISTAALTAVPSR